MARHIGRTHGRRHREDTYGEHMAGHIGRTHGRTHKENTWQDI